MDDSNGLAIAFEEAKLSYAAGGIPVSCQTTPTTLPHLHASRRIPNAKKPSQTTPQPTADALLL